MKIIVIVTKVIPKLDYNVFAMVYKLEVIVIDVHTNQTQLGMDIFANVMKDIHKLKDNVNQILRSLVQIHLLLVQ